MIRRRATYRPEIYLGSAFGFDQLADPEATQHIRDRVDLHIHGLAWRTTPDPETRRAILQNFSRCALEVDDTTVPTEHHFVGEVRGLGTNCILDRAFVNVNKLPYMEGWSKYAQSPMGATLYANSREMLDCYRALYMMRGVLPVALFTLWNKAAEDPEIVRWPYYVFDVIARLGGGVALDNPGWLSCYPKEDPRWVMYREIFAMVRGVGQKVYHMFNVAREQDFNESKKQVCMLEEWGLLPDVWVVNCFEDLGFPVGPDSPDGVLPAMSVAGFAFWLAQRYGGVDALGK